MTGAHLSHKNAHIYIPPSWVFELSCTYGVTSLTKVWLAEFLGILSTSFVSFYESYMYILGGGHTANGALLASLCKTLFLSLSICRLLIWTYIYFLTLCAMNFDFENRIWYDMSDKCLWLPLNTYNLVMIAFCSEKTDYKL